MVRKRFDWVDLLPVILIVLVAFYTFVTIAYEIAGLNQLSSMQVFLNLNNTNQSFNNTSYLCNCNCNRELR